MTTQEIVNRYPKYRIYKKNGGWDLLSKIQPSLKTCCTSLLNNIWMSERWWNDPVSIQDEENKVALLLHEICHIEQYRRERFTYPFKYLFNKNKRKDYELEAYKIQITHLLRSDIYVDIEGYATTMSTIYGPLNFISKNEAVQVLNSWITEYQQSGK